jgi:hypothetical protein
VLPRFDRRQALVLGICVVLQLLAVVAVALREPRSGGVAVVAALLLAPLAVLGVATTAARFADGWFAIAASGVFVLLPFLTNRLLLAPHRSEFDRHALPALVGTQSTWLLAIGVAAVALAAFLPERVAAGAGLVGLAVAAIVWSPSALGDLQPLLHETAWSVAFPEWLLVATIAGVVFRRPYLGTALGCLAVAVVLRGAHQPDDNSGFWRALAPLVPSGAVLLSSLWLLVPRLRPAGVRRAAS